MFEKEECRKQVLEILHPMKPLAEARLGDFDLPYFGYRSAAGNELPVYYLVFFLLHDLLDFPYIGQQEKLAWSFPIEYGDELVTIDYRKFGVGIFINNEKNQELAWEIVRKIKRAINLAKPFFDLIAEEAVQKSELNVNNRCEELFDRYEYLLTEYKKTQGELEKVKGQTRKVVENVEGFGSVTKIVRLDIEFLRKSNWLAISCIEAFFSWTEHLFVHLAIVSELMFDGLQVSKLIAGEWKDKYRAAIPAGSKEADKFYNELLIIRQQLRNFVAHGAFGKDGNAFVFHSDTGGVPVIMHYKKNHNKYSLQGDLAFRDDEVIKIIEEFILFLWKDDIGIVMQHVQKYGLPSILMCAKDGQYEFAKTDIDTMIRFCDDMQYRIDQAGNMDW